MDNNGYVGVDDDEGASVDAFHDCLASSVETFSPSLSEIAENDCLVLDEGHRYLEMERGVLHRNYSSLSLGRQVTDLKTRTG